MCYALDMYPRSMTRRPLDRAPRASQGLALAALLAACGCATTNGTGPLASSPGSPDDPQPKDPSAGAALSYPASAPPSVEATKDLPADGTVKAQAVPIAGSEWTRGRATVTVKAPMDKVRATLLDYERYPEFMPEFSGSKILGRMPGGGHQVYQQMSILGGTVKIWAQVEVPKPTIEGDTETYSGTMMKGNIKEYEAIWKLRPLDASHTELTAELRLVPPFPVPVGWMNGKNVEGAAKAVQAMKRRVETRP